MSLTPPPRRRPLWGAAAELFGGRTRESVVSGEPAPSTLTSEAAGDPGWRDALLDALPEPALILAGASRDEPSGWRFVAANSQARDTWRIVRPEGPLLTVLRDPAVLEAVALALFDRKAAETVHETPTVHERIWRVMVRPLGATTEAGEHRALLLLRDETDQRRADQTRADFLANASHELRTPLASLLGFIETLRGHARTDPAAREKFLGIMQAQAERMSRLIDDLMSLSRIELNEHIPPSGEADLAQVALDVVDALGPLAAERGVRLSPTTPPLGAAVLVGDRDQIVQVAQNLIDNALKYSRQGGEVRVEVLGEVSAPDLSAPRQEGRSRFWLLGLEHAPEQRFVQLRVTDTGPGLAREHIPRLAERFYRVEGQKSGERSGTGLGLAIVKHIVYRHRGGLLVESTVGEGAAFTVFLPRKPAITV